MSTVIDPKKITKFDRTEKELQIFLLFAVAVAGKNADTTSRAITKLLQHCEDEQMPFDFIRDLSDVSLHNLLVVSGVGQYGRIEKCFSELAHAKLDLRKCTVKSLEAIHGIGPKTARFFVLHSRRDAKCGVIDRQILKYLREKQVSNVPTNTPGSMKEYRRLENAFIIHAKKDFPGLSLAEVDLLLWVKYSGRLEE